MAEFVGGAIVPGIPHPLLCPEQNEGWQQLRDGFEALSARIQELEPDVLVVYSTMWPSVVGHQIQARANPVWTHVDELFHDLGSIPYSFRIDAELAHALNDAATARGLHSRTIDYHGFPIDTGSVTALSLLTPNNEVPAVIVSSNVYADRAETVVFGKSVRDALKAQGKTAFAVCVMTLSNRLFTDFIDPKDDHVHSPKDEEWNQKFLEFAGDGRIEDLAQLSRVIQQQIRVKKVVNFKPLWWLSAVMGRHNHYDGHVHAYAALYGTGAAVIRFEPSPGGVGDKEYDEDDVEVWQGDRNVLGGDQGRSGDLQVAESDGEQMLAGTTDARMRARDAVDRGRSLQRDREFERAIDSFKAATHLDPTYVDAWLRMGICCEDDRQFRRAIECYEKAIELKPDHHQAATNIGESHRKNERYAEAIKAYDRALVMRPDYLYSLAGRAEAMRMLGDYEASLEWFDRALKRGPNHAFARQGKGAALNSLHRWDEALPLWEAALEIDPKSQFAKDGLSFCVAMMKRERSGELPLAEADDGEQKKLAATSDTSATVTDKAPDPVGPYPHARREGEFLYLSGMGPRQPGTDAIPGGPIRDETGEPLDYDVAAQTRAVIENIKTVLHESGTTLESVVDITCFLVDMDRDFATFNRVYREYFETIRPTRTTVAVRALPTPIAVELKVVARP